MPRKFASVPFKRIILFYFLPVLAALAGCTARSLDIPELTQLDEMLESRDHYQAVFTEHVSALKSLRAEASDERGEFQILLAIADEYQANSYDSTLVYLQQARAVAESLQDDSRIVQTDIMLAMEHVREASSIMESLGARGVPQELQGLWNRLQYTFYYSANGTSQIDEVNARYSAMADSLAWVLIDGSKGIIPDAFSCNLRLVTQRNLGNYSVADSLGNEFLSLFKPGTKDYAYMAWAHAIDVQDPERKAALFAESYMSDISCANRDCASLEELINILFDYQEAKRSFNYLAFCMLDASQFNGRYRSVAAARAFPRIEKLYAANNSRMMRHIVTMLVILAVFTVALVVILMVLAGRQRALMATRVKLQDSLEQIERQNETLSIANDQLNSLNVKIKQSDKVKQDYVALFLSMLSDNINTSRKYRNHVRNLIKQGKTDKLLNEITPDDQQGVDEFYHMFDQAFVNMFPDFVEKFNDLLVEEGRIVPKQGELLTPELRVFALIKLGVADSSKIASLLHYSANTIYNYRSKVKNSAKCDRSQFEDCVKQL